MHHEPGHFEEESLEKSRGRDFKLLGRLWPYIRPYRRRLSAAILLVVLITALDLAIPWITKETIDRYIVPAPAGQAIQRDAGASSDGDRSRLLRVDPNQPGVPALIEHYPSLFQVAASGVTIAYRDLSRLEPAEIARIRPDDLAGVARMTLLFLALVVAIFLLNFVQQMIMEYTGQMVMHDLRMHLFGHVKNLSAAFFNRNPVGRLVTRLTNDIQNMNEFFTSIIVFVFKDLFLLTGICLVMFSIDWRLSLVALSVVPFVLLASYFFAAQAREAYRTLRQKVAEINVRFSETITGMRIIQLFRQEAANYDRFRTLNHENFLAGMRQIHVFAVFMPIIEVLGSVALAAIIFYGGAGVLDDRITLGALVAFISYIRMFFRPIRDISEKYNVMQNAMASAERIFQILDNHQRLEAATPQAPSTAAVTPPADFQSLRFEAVSFGYQPTETVLHNIDFEIPAGESVAIVGPTGSGKTSLINLLMRFYDPTAGRILYNGIDLKTMPPDHVRRQMALVAQDPFLFSGTIADNIRFGQPALSAERLQQIVRAANCEALVAQLEGGLDYRLSEGGTRLSSGERQLIAIARALARDPHLIILDEATSYIDSQTEQQVQGALKNLLADRTALIIAHRLSTAREADRIIVLNRGRIIESGSHDQLMRKQAFYYQLYRLQA
jgi:ATP-binding cassette subfamily B protein